MIGGVEVRHLTQPELEPELLEGTLDLGLVNLLDSDDLHRRTLLAGRPTVALPTGHRLAEHQAIDHADLRREPFIGAREGYLMRRVVHRIFDGDPPPRWHTVDGADIGKQMVAAGLGVMVLPDFTVAGDPTVAAGLVIERPLAGEVPTIRLTALRRRAGRPPARLTALMEELVAQAREIAGNQIEAAAVPGA